MSRHVIEKNKAQEKPARGGVGVELETRISLPVRAYCEIDIEDIDIQLTYFLITLSPSPVFMHSFFHSIFLFLYFLSFFL